MDSRPRVPPLLVLTFGILAVSTGSIFVRYAQAYAPSLVVAAFRLSLAALMLTPLALSTKQRELRSLQPVDLILTMLSGFFLALHFATWISSLEYTSVASSVVLVSTTPIWVALLSPFTLKEPITRLLLAGMVLTFLGVVIVGLSDTCTWSGGQIICPQVRDFIRGGAFLGDLLAIAGAMFAAGYVIVGRKIRSGLSLLGYIFIVYGMAAVVLVSFMFAAGESPFGYPPPAFLWFFLLALIPQLMGHSSFNWALGYVSAAFVSITLLGEPIGATILAYFLLGEAPTLLKVFGAILILSGIYVASRSQVNKSPAVSIQPVE